ncbi:MAG: tetratricopeptide repeat protein [Sedimentisphaeraceae bacterium JB056]
MRFILLMLCLLAAAVTEAANRYDSEFLRKQTAYYPTNTIKFFIERGDYENAAFNALSFYPISPEISIETMISIENKIDKDLQNYIFGVFKKRIVTDRSLRSGGKKNLIREDWMNQKSAWSDDFINEIICYKKIRENFEHPNLSFKEFFWEAFDVYYNLDNEKASEFAKDISNQPYKLEFLCLYAKRQKSGKVGIDELHKFKALEKEKAIAEMLTVLEGQYYMKHSDYERAKEVYLKNFDLQYAIPVHIENLANCYLAEKDMSRAKRLYRYLASLVCEENITSEGIYNLGCICALEGDKDKAIKYIKQAVDSGFSRSYVRNDSDLKCLYKDKRFIKLITEEK